MGAPARVGGHALNGRSGRGDLVMVHGVHQGLARGRGTRGGGASAPAAPGAQRKQLEQRVVRVLRRHAHQQVRQRVLRHFAKG